MATRNTQQRKNFAAIGIALLTAIAISGCGGPESDEGVNVTVVELPTDTILNLACVDVGINAETCILDDPENPFRFVATPEFNVNDEDALTKFELFANLPGDETGAKAAFYLWATAQARFPSGENQYYTALSLHRLWDAEGDPIVRDQALRAYRSVLENYFGSVTFFVFFDGAPPISFPLNELTADKIVFSEITAGLASLVDGDTL
ncbi:MAG: hypothetical protein HKN56_05690, partial [Gammaproteobacteria bacterium]|nr:hypothetical protein [Gammaproteobacteria bacterium]